MKNDDQIKHEGVVQSIVDDQINVMILSKSACAACHAKGVCSMADMQEKMVSVPIKENNAIGVGDKVNVIMTTSSGVKAVFWGYILPFLIVFTVLFTLLLTVGNEGLAALAALGSLIPYYLVLTQLRPSFKKKFSFHLEPFVGE